MKLNYGIELTRVEREAIKLVGDLINEMYENRDKVYSMLDTFYLETLKDQYEDFSQAIDDYFGD